MEGFACAQKCFVCPVSREWTVACEGETWSETYRGSISTTTPGHPHELIVSNGFHVQTSEFRVSTLLLAARYHRQQLNKTETTAPWPSCVQRGTLLSFRFAVSFLLFTASTQTELRASRSPEQPSYSNPVAWLRNKLHESMAGTTPHSLH